MNRNDTIEVLAKITAFDRRTIGEADVAAWHDTIGDLNKTDAMDAVSQHFRTSDKWLMPVHLRALAREIARERMLRETTEERLERTDAIDAKIEHRQRAIANFAAGIGHIA